ncbi:MAG: membrane dipeptidase [Gammaproteobacteria bacterium]|jgi:hypothetical protein
MKFHGRIPVATVPLMQAAAAVFFSVVPGEVARHNNPVILPPPYPVSVAAVGLHRQLFVADRPADSLLWGRDLPTHGRAGHVDVPRLLPGNAGLQTVSVVTQVPAGRNFTRNASDAPDIITLLAIAQHWPLRTWGSTLAHASAALTDEVLALATRPVPGSHGGVGGTCDNHRSLSDARAQAVAASGGMIGFWPRATGGEVGAATVRALRHAVDQAGVEHVAPGSDFDGSVQVPFDVSGLRLLTEALLQASFEPAAIEKAMEGNVVRVLQAAG